MTDKPGDHLANKRTFLTGIRTGTSVIVFCFVVAKFGITLRELLRLQGNAATKSEVSLLIGIAFMAMGVLMALLAVWGYRITLRLWNLATSSPLVVSSFSSAWSPPCLASFWPSISS